MKHVNAEPDRLDLTKALKDEAFRVGFNLVGVANAVTPLGLSRFQEWLRAGFAGEMLYLPRRALAYEHPRHVLPVVRSILMLGVNYRTDDPIIPNINQGQVARYAWGDTDYHDLMRDQLHELSESVHRLRPDCTTRGVVDTAPLLERDFARLAGLGWFGKNTMLINRRQGSWFLLAGLLTDLELEADLPHETTHCGTCTRCLDACPTDAFPEPHVLDAQKCISYLTIELKTQIPIEFRDGIGSWLFGCDVCQNVCPWNRKAPTSGLESFRPVPDLAPCDCIDILKMTQVEFENRFSKTPLARPGLNGLKRNAAIVLGNQGDSKAIEVLIRSLDKDPSPLVRGASAWSLGKLGGNEASNALQCRLLVESNDEVLNEIKAALVRIDGVGDH